MFKIGIDLVLLVVVLLRLLSDTVRTANCGCQMILF